MSYLTARILSRLQNISQLKKLISIEPDFSHVKSSWLNTLSFLLAIWKNNDKLRRQFLEWLSVSNPATLIKVAKLEKDRIDVETREQVFRCVYDACMKENMVVGYKEYNHWDLAEFGDTKRIIDFLISELTFDRTTIVKSNILVLLKDMNSHNLSRSNSEKLRLLLLDEIFGNKNYKPESQSFAIDTLINLFPNIVNITVNRIINTFFNCKNSQIRTSVYKLIIEKQKQDEYISWLIRRTEEIKDDSWRGDILLVDESIYLKRCFESINSETSLVKFFTAYSTVITDEYGRFPDDLPLAELLNRAIVKVRYRLNIIKIFNCMKTDFAQWIGFRSSGIDKNIVIEFININELRFEFFTHCVDEGKWFDVAPKFMDSKGIDYLVEKFKNNDIDTSIAQKYIGWSENLGINSDVLVSKLNNVGNHEFIKPKIERLPPYEETQEKAFLEQKRLLFDKILFSNMLSEVFDKCGKNKFDEKEVFIVKINGEIIYQQFPLFIIQFINSNHRYNKSQLLDLVNSEWDWLSIRDLKNFLIESEQYISENQYLKFDSTDIDYFKNWCDYYSIKFLEGDKTTHGDITFAWYVVNFAFTHYSERLYSKMLVSNLQHFLGTQYDIISFLEANDIFSLKKIEKVLSNQLLRRDLNNLSLLSFLSFIDRHNLKSCIPILQKYMENNRDKYTLNRVTEIYIRLNGNDNFLLDLIKRSDPTEENYFISTILNHFLENPNEFFESILDQKLESVTNPKIKLTYAEYLVGINNLSGLNYFLHYIKTEKKSPFSNYTFKRHRSFNNIAGLSTLIKIMNFGTLDVIQQDIKDDIISNCCDMIYQIAISDNSKNYQNVKTYIQKRIKRNELVMNLPTCLKRRIFHLNDNTVNRLKYLLKDIKIGYSQNQKYSLKDAVEQWEMLDVK